MKNKKDFKKSYRLLNKEEYDLLYKSGKRIVLQNFIAFVKKNAFDSARLGLSFSKKRIPKATGRNKIKRIFRESFRLHRFLLKNCDIVVTIRDSRASELSNQSLFFQADELWKNVEKYFS